MDKEIFQVKLSTVTRNEKSRKDIAIPFKVLKLCFWQRRFQFHFAAKIGSCSFLFGYKKQVFLLFTFASKDLRIVWTNILEFIYISYLLSNQQFPKWSIFFYKSDESSRNEFSNSFILAKPLKLFKEIFLCFRRVFIMSFVCFRMTQTTRSFKLIF